MPQHVELLLTESVEALGIVGDVVRVRTGYARNYLLPLNLATTPTEEKIKALSVKRADAEQHQRELRSQRETLSRRLEGVEITIQRSCNDQGQLYGSVSQQDIAEALVVAGFNVTARDVRLSQVVKRVDTYHIPIKLDRDLDAEVTLKVAADRAIALDDRDEMEFDNEGELIEKPKGEKKSRREREREAEGAPAEGADAHAGEKKDKKHKKGEGESAAAPAEEKKGTFSKREPKADAAPVEEKKGSFSKREPKADAAPAEKKGKKRE